MFVVMRLRRDSLHVLKTFHRERWMRHFIESLEDENSEFVVYDSERNEFDHMHVHKGTLEYV